MKADEAGSGASGQQENENQEVKPVRKYNTGFGKKKAGKNLDAGEVTCPFSNCGRKFPSDTMLKAHMDRRHRAPEVEETKAIESTQASETPIPSRNKAKAEGIQEESKEQYTFQAKPKIQRPQTAHQSNKMSAEQAALIRSMHQ